MFCHKLSIEADVEVMRMELILNITLERHWRQRAAARMLQAGTLCLRPGHGLYTSGGFIVGVAETSNSHCSALLA